MRIGPREVRWHSYLGLLAWGTLIAGFASASAILRRVPPSGLKSFEGFRDEPAEVIMFTFILGVGTLILASFQRQRGLLSQAGAWAFGACGIAALGGVMLLSAQNGMQGDPFRGWSTVMFFWLASWLFLDCVANVQFKSDAGEKWRRVSIPILFGLSLIMLWEAIVVGTKVPSVLLPPPSMIWERLVSSTDTLWADFRQTFLKGALVGYALGCGAAFLTAIAIDRSPFLQRGLLPVGNLVAALPIIGIAPIMVMWFGFDWPSKAAVVVVMCFFPMLVNTVEGLKAADRMQADLMRTWAASYSQAMWKLRMPAAAPFIFNGLKICSTLALIGAIVAEFFGTPVVGMGFRISTEVGRMNIDMVWATIAVAALAGSAFYGAIVVIERWVTFWHPSVRGGRGR